MAGTAMLPGGLPRYGFTLPRLSPAGLAAVVALHGLVLYLLMQMELTRLPPPAPVLQVALIAAPAALPAAPEPPPPTPEIVPPRPQPMREPPRPVTQDTPPEPDPPPPATPIAAPLVSLPAEAAVETRSSVPPPPEAPAAPVALASIPPPAQAAPPAARAQAAPTPPRFDADYLHNPRPVYPPLSRRLGEEGRVVLRVMVSAEGQPIHVRLHASSGSARLDQAALEAVSRWRFVPARQGEASVAAAVLVPIVFSLQG